jgi:alkaline phosphatase D
VNAGAFGPGTVDNTFGPEVKFFRAPPKGKSNLPPNSGFSFFGEVQIEAKTRVMTVTLRNVSGAALFVQRLNPV